MDSLLSRCSSFKLLQPPYLDSSTLTHNSPWCCKGLHFRLPSNARLKVSISFIPKPPFSFGRHTVSHLIQAILFWSCAPPYRNLLCKLTSLSSTFLGTLKTPLSNKYISCTLRTEASNVRLLPNRLFRQLSEFR